MCARVLLALADGCLGRALRPSFWPPLPVMAKGGWGACGSPRRLLSCLSQPWVPLGKQFCWLTEGRHHLHSMLTGQRPTGTLGGRGLSMGTGGGKYAQRFEGFAWGHLGRDREEDCSLGLSGPGL